MKSCGDCGAVIIDMLQLYFTCVDCGNKVLCPRCFLHPNSDSQHKTSTHAYSVGSNLANVKLPSGWTFSEELRLLEAIELYGLGSWRTIAQEVFASKRRPKEIKDHFFSSIAKNQERARLPSSVLQLSKLPKKRRVEQDKKEKKMQQEFTKGVHFLERYHIEGYLPMRNEFFTAFKNDFELSLTDLSVRLPSIFNIKDISSNEKSEILKTLLSLREYHEVLLQRTRRNQLAVKMCIPELKARGKAISSDPFELELRKLLFPVGKIFGFNDFDAIIHQFKEQRKQLKLLSDAFNWSISPKNDSNSSPFLLSLKKVGNVKTLYMLRDKPDRARRKKSKLSISSTFSVETTDDQDEESDICERMGMSVLQFKAFKFELFKQLLAQKIIRKAGSASFTPVVTGASTPAEIILQKAKRSFYLPHPAFLKVHITRHGKFIDFLAELYSESDSGKTSGPLD